MTEEEFLNIVQSWYDRTHKLREISENALETKKRKQKAFKLFLEMAGRMQNVCYNYSLIKMRHCIPNYKNGGFNININD